MIDSAKIAKLLGAAALLCALGAAGAAAAFGPREAGGVILGFALGAAPFASWAWLASRLAKGRPVKALGAVLAILKLGLYAGALWIFVSRQGFHPAGIFGGLTAVVATVCVGGLLAAPAPKEAA
jgi:FtsH-binding integral membrane protein